MDVASYEQRTRENVERFLKKRKQAITSELERLGKPSRCVNWKTLKLILADLKSEGLVRKTRIGSKLVLYEWIGG